MKQLEEKKVMHSKLALNSDAKKVLVLVSLKDDHLAEEWEIWMVSQLVLKKVRRWAEEKVTLMVKWSAGH